MNELPPGIRATLDIWYPTGWTWEQVRSTAEFAAHWRHLGRDGPHVLVRHHDGAVVGLRFREAGGLESRLIMEGRKADELYSVYGFACPAHAQAALDDAMQTCGSVDGGLVLRYGPRMRGIEHLNTEITSGGRQRRLYQLHREGGAVLDVRVGLDGEVEATHYLLGPRARAVVDRVHDTWARGHVSGGDVLRARTWGEALLLLAVQGAHVRAIHEVPTPSGDEVRLLTSEGPRCWRMHIADRLNLRNEWLGEGAPALLDPALLVLVGRRRLQELEGNRPSTIDRAVAAAALSSVLDLIPRGQSEVPPEALPSAAGRALAQRERTYFTRRWLTWAIDTLRRG